ncbi:PLP-dependent aminotransferase family protein [Salegentibacter salegens]|uniref:Cys/Met metabolism PLP-dependent enzyme n=1 Tax=Salegentibacter salegens TaxID=143223 RepID=A0A1M7MGS5_9FLAO|nr:PLP-dependent transferase [Salegentibacter salegens]PRX48100.1 Cys/Met metabolism PLP-dependent enzyme [Salegentibacter salegens]SHM89604.1 Cys/Met metabolism PLP-dependent enzyme [Salegentibacter salegens]
MKEQKVLNYIDDIIENIPNDWLKLTTHRLDIYNEKLAKTEFVEKFEKLFAANNSETSALKELPTAFDYIRLGHPLSSVLEWGIAKLNDLKSENIISFSSRTIPVLAILRKNLFDKKNTQIIYSGSLPEYFDAEALKRVYGYNFELKQVEKPEEITEFNGSTIFISQEGEIGKVNLNPNIDFWVSVYPKLGSILLVNGEKNERYISEIQHVRRRESIAMTPADSFSALKLLTGKPSSFPEKNNIDTNKASVIDSIKKITATNSNALLGSCGLSVQYAIMMGLIDEALEKHPGKAIKIVVPPNCYGGTNDQARRVAASLDNVEIVDLPVDGDNDMVQSTDMVLDQVAKDDAVPYIIAEIPTNPRVEVPDLEKLKEALSKKRKTASGEAAIDPVFILDQTFCPNVQFLAEDGILSSIKSISYVSGSKFPSGGKCTAGYCVANQKAENLLSKIDKHLVLCDNEATALQIEILAGQLPSMNQRIADAYKNTREFVNFIRETLPEAKINFVSEELATQGFTPSVFSLDLPTKGNTDEEREAYKRELNLKLINMMISKIPNESKYCVSYGQLKGCYWTIPATSTQGTTKEDDKDYIARVSVSPDLDLELHKKVFLEFVEEI